VKRDVVSIRCPKCAKIFTLPLITADADKDETPSAAVIPGARGTNRILVVDDARFFREVIVDLLKPLDVICFTASNAEEALSLLHREHPDLVLLDLNLPGKSGYDLIRELRADSAFVNLKILAMSGVFRDETDISAVITAGANDFISKSFKPEQLQFRISKLLAG
jgi:DNA-binding response OmpR family regulator